jgi:hypothetical protein
MLSSTPAAIVLRHLVAVCATILLAPSAGWAGPPYMTDDPEPVEYRHWEVYLAGQHFVSRDGASGSAPFMDLNYGVWPGLQLHFMGQLAYVRPSTGPGFYGVGDTELGAKIRFLNEGEWWPMMSVYPLFDFPTGDAAHGLGTGHVHAFVPLWLQKSFGAWTTFGGGGIWANPGTGNRDYWYVGWEVQRRFSDRTTIGTEIFYTTPDQVRADAKLRFNVGLLLDLTLQHHLLFSAGRSIVGGSLFQGYAAYQLTL